MILQHDGPRGRAFNGRSTWCGAVDGMPGDTGGARHGTMGANVPSNRGGRHHTPALRPYVKRVSNSGALDPGQITRGAWRSSRGATPLRRGRSSSASPTAWHLWTPRRPAAPLSSSGPRAARDSILIPVWKIQLRSHAPVLQKGGVPGGSVLYHYPYFAAIPCICRRAAVRRRASSGELTRRRASQG